MIPATVLTELIWGLVIACLTVGAWGILQERRDRLQAQRLALYVTRQRTVQRTPVRAIPAQQLYDWEAES